MAMAEGERAECAEHPQEEPPADGALKRAEELKTEANDYFKGASALEGVRGGWRATQVEGCRARSEPWQRGAAVWARARHYQVTRRGEAQDSSSPGRQEGLLRERVIPRSGGRSGATKWGD